MRREIVDLSDALLKTTSYDWDIDWRNRSPGTTSGGTQPVVVSRFPQWVGSPDIVLHGGHIAAFRAIRWQARGMQNVYRVWMRDKLVGAELPPAQPFSNGQSFLGGARFQHVPTYMCVDDAPAGSEFITVDVVGDAALPAVGRVLSHNDWPFGITSVSDGGQAGRYVLGVAMALRRAIPANELISLKPTGLFVATEDGMGNPAYGQTLVARPGLSFREWLTRP